MLKTNNLTVPAVVAKYVNSVNFDGALRAHERNPYEANEIALASPHQQLIAKLWYNNQRFLGLHVDKKKYSALSAYIEAFHDNILREEESYFLFENYSETIEYLFKERKNWKWSISIENDIPLELADISEKILCLESGQSLFLPFCGYGDVAVKFPQCRIIGFVEDATVAALTQIRLAAAGIDAEISYQRTDEPLLNISDMIFDAIICSQIASSEINVLYQSCSLEKLYCNNIAPHIVAFCNSSLLSSNARNLTSFRAKMLAELSIAAIVELPQYIYRDSANSPLLLYIDKTAYFSEEDIPGIVMYNASSAVRNIGSTTKAKRLDVDTFSSDINNASKPELQSIIRRIPYGDIDSDILFPRYYLLNRDINTGRKLSEIVSIAERQRIEPTGMRYKYSVDEHDLSFMFNDAHLTLDKIDASSPETRRISYFCPVKPCIFLTVTSTVAFVGYSDLSDPNAYYSVPPMVKCMYVNNGFSVEYVAALLLTENVSEQITAMVLGPGLRGVNDSFLSKVYVPKQDKEQMSHFLEEKFRDSMSDKEKELIEERNKYERNVRLRKHALTQSVSSFGALFNTLNKCRQRNGGVLHDEDIVSPISKKTVAQIFDTLAARMSSIQEKLSKIADVEFDFGESVNIDPEEFILNYIDSKENGWLNFHGETGWDKTKTFNKSKEDYRLPSDGSLVLAKGEPICTFSFPKKALEHIFNNIVSNALAHGFTDEKRNDYKIRFSWETQGMDLIVTVENNGSPLPEGVQPEDILSYGFSTKLNVDGHNGLGGSEIESIMRDYKGKVEVISQPDEEYPVKYKLIFTNTKYTFVHYL